MRASIGTGVVLIAVGGVLAAAVTPPQAVEDYVDVLDLGLILVWAGVLTLVMQVVMHRRRRPRARGFGSYEADLPEGDPWAARDVHRPGYLGETRRLPTIRDDDRR